MAQNRTLNVEGIALTTTLTTNLFNTAITSLSGPVGYTQTQPYAIFRHARVVNKTGTAATVSLWKGASGANAAGSEWNWQATSVAANSSLDWYGIARFDAADFLVGGSGTASALTLILEGEIGLA
jgi:hypothetical protein